jgi:homoserine dehydrogenase
MPTSALHRLALIGFGVVGQALVEIIQHKRSEFEQQYDLKIQIVAVATRSKGSLYHPDGLDIAKLLPAIQTSGNLAAYPDSTGLSRGWDGGRIAAESNADTVVEVSYTNLQTGQPAIDYCRAALRSGKHVVTANKGPLALAYRELAELAHHYGVELGFESTVMAGTPAIRGGHILKGSAISEISGIFNGTTNFILTKMEADQASFADALAEAQRLGYAEADPSGDVEGHDAAAKVVILANVLMEADLTLDQVATTGISQLTPADITAAQGQGKRWKLIGRVSRENGRVRASVAPEMLPLANPLAGVSGATNAITYQTDLLGPITLVGPGAGGKETAAGILADILTIIA